MLEAKDEMIVVLGNKEFYCHWGKRSIESLRKLELYRTADRILEEALRSSTTVSSMLVVRALADFIMVIIELHEFSKRIYTCTMFFFKIYRCPFLTVINM